MKIPQKRGIAAHRFLLQTAICVALMPVAGTERPEPNSRTFTRYRTALESGQYKEADLFAQDGRVYGVADQSPVRALIAIIPGWDAAPPSPSSSVISVKPHRCRRAVYSASV